LPPTSPVVVISARVRLQVRTRPSCCHAIDARRTPVGLDPPLCREQVLLPEPPPSCALTDRLRLTLTWSSGRVSIASSTPASRQVPAAGESVFSPLSTNRASSGSLHRSALPGVTAGGWPQLTPAVTPDPLCYGCPFTSDGLATCLPRQERWPPCIPAWSRAPPRAEGTPSSTTPHPIRVHAPCLAISPGVVSPASTSAAGWAFALGKYCLLSVVSASSRHSPGRRSPHNSTRSTHSAHLSSSKGHARYL